MKNISWRIIVIGLSAIAGLLLCISDAFFESYFFSDQSFLEALLFPNAFEVYVRIFVLTIVIVNGIVASMIVARLEKASEEIKTLRGIIPICAVCHSIRDDAGAWRNVVSYVRDHSEADFSHGLCPDCFPQCDLGPNQQF